MTKIEWCWVPGFKGETWNPVVGCSIATAGCTNCYAMSMAARIQRMTPGSHYTGTTKEVNGNHVWTGKMVLAPDHILDEPLRAKKPRAYFVNSMGDLFHKDVPGEWINAVFARMALSPQHIFIVLTKRADVMRDYMSAGERGGIVKAKAWAVYHTDQQGAGALGMKWPLPNVWLGVSAERQQEADERIPLLLATPAAVRLVSAEPLLGPIDFNLRIGDRWHKNALDGSFGGRGLPAQGSAERDSLNGSRLDWIIVGGESGKGARPMHPDWVRSIRNQCLAADVPFFFKQWGEWAWSPEGLAYTTAATTWGNAHFPRGTHFEHHSCGRTAFRVGKGVAGHLLDGAEYHAWPRTEVLA